VDLSPRTLEPRDGDDTGDGNEFVPPAPRVRNSRKWVSIGLLVLVLAGGGVILTQFLNNSLDYYCNVNEVGAEGQPGVKGGCETGRQIRIQGRVVEGSLSSADGVTRFQLIENGVTRPVVYDGDPAGSFQECIPVVVRGVMSDQLLFTGDEMEVKHGNDYQEKGEARPSEADEKALACDAAASGSNQ